MKYHTSNLISNLSFLICKRRGIIYILQKFGQDEVKYMCIRPGPEKATYKMKAVVTP